MTDVALLSVALAFVYAMARLRYVNQRAAKMGVLLVLGLAGHQVIPMIASSMSGVVPADSLRADAVVVIPIPSWWPSDRIVYVSGANPTTGPNQPEGATLVYRMDVTQADQTDLNPDGSFGCSAAWATQPDWNSTSGDTTFVRFQWNSGQNESDPGDCEYNVPAGTYNDLYVRVIWRANAAWQTNGGGGKHLFLQNGAGAGTNNNAPAFGIDDGIDGTYGNSAVTMNLYTSWLYTTGDPHDPTGDWYEDEYIYTNLETNTNDGTVEMFVNGVAQSLSASGTGVQFSQSGDGINIIKVGPFHGGSGAKSTSNDYIDYQLVEVWKFTP